MVEDTNDFNDNCDEELNQTSHKKLLSAVSRIYNKQRVDRPKRSEPYINVSEYHLSNQENKEDGPNKIEVFDLVKALDKKISNQKIKSKFKSLQTASRKLPKPLEKIYSDQIKRSVGYEHIKKHVSRWNELVTNNRTAPQLSFPLQNDSPVKTYEPLSFLNTFKEPTELEKNMAEVLQGSSVAQKDAEVEEAIFKLSVPEMIKKRKLIAQLKAKESFKIVKAMKQNKIKSKKYRRIQRKEKLKQELKEFESLQKTDPEAALEKLNKLEKDRAEERASLRHRNTGKWARGQAIRAKYDVEARIQLSEQIAKSREITRKREINEESSDEEEEEEDNEEEYNMLLKKDMKDGISKIKGDDDNPWTEDIGENNQTVNEFVAGYQNYCKTKKDEPVTKASVNKIALARLIGNDKNNIANQDSSVTTENQDHHDSNDDNVSIDTMENLNSIAIANESTNITNNICSNESSSRTEKKFDIPKKNKKVNLRGKIDSNILNSKKKNCNELTTCDSELSTKNSKEKSASRKRKQTDLFSRAIKKRESIKNDSGSWSIESAPELSDSVLQNEEELGKNKETIDDLFDKVEDKIYKKIKKFNNFSNDEDDKTESKKKDIDGLPNENINHNMAQKKNYEIPSQTINDENGGIEDLLKMVEDNDESKLKDKINTTNPTIDPNKFLNVKPRLLHSEIPDVLVEGDDALDDPEDDRRAKISEAFAEDDVVEQFRKEKDEEIKNSQEQDIDLFLPGWGSWGGPNVNPKVIKKKRKRFIIKAPKQKRKDSAKPNVIISQDISAKYKQHLVSDVPFPFTSVRDFEASVRAPIGSTWVPEIAVNKLTQPSVVKKLGAIIEPMNENQLAKDKSRKSKLKINNFNKDDESDIK